MLECVRLGKPMLTGLLASPATVSLPPPPPPPPLVGLPPIPSIHASQIPSPDTALPRLSALLPVPLPLLLAASAPELPDRRTRPLPPPSTAALPLGALLLALPVYSLHTGRKGDRGGGRSEMGDDWSGGRVGTMVASGSVSAAKSLGPAFVSALISPVCGLAASPAPVSFGPPALESLVLLRLRSLT